MSEWKLVPVELTAENGMKAKLIGEFRLSIADRDEDGNECLREITVPWDTIKKIHRAVVAAAATPPEAEPVGFRCKNKDEQEDDWSWLPIRFFERNKSDSRVFELLYTHPSDDNLRKAGELQNDLQRRVNNLEEQNGNLLNHREDILQENHALKRAAERVISQYMKAKKMDVPYGFISALEQLEVALKPK